MIYFMIKILILLLFCLFAYSAIDRLIGKPKKEKEEDFLDDI